MKRLEDALEDARASVFELGIAASANRETTGVTIQISDTLFREDLEKILKIADRNKVLVYLRVDSSELRFYR